MTSYSIIQRNFVRQTAKYVDFYRRNALSYSSYIYCFSILLITSNPKQKLKIKCDLLRNSNRQARLKEAFHLRESCTWYKECVIACKKALLISALAHAFLCLQENMWLCVTCIVSSTWYFPNNHPNQCWIKKKCILVILFAKSFTFSSSWYCPINYPNQHRMKNQKHSILAILFTKSCTFSKSLFPVHSTFQPIAQIDAEWKKLYYFGHFIYTQLHSFTDCV